MDENNKTQLKKTKRATYTKNQKNQRQKTTQENMKHNFQGEKVRLKSKIKYVQNIF